MKFTFVYLDTNIFLNPILYDPNKNEEARKSIKILKKVLESEIEAYTSLLTWDEFSYILKRTFTLDIAVEKSSAFLQFSNLNFISITKPVIMKAQMLFEKYGSNPRDSIHAACAILNGIETFISFDADFKMFKEFKLINNL